MAIILGRRRRDEIDRGPWMIFVTVFFIKTRSG